MNTVREIEITDQELISTPENVLRYIEKLENEIEFLKENPLDNLVRSGIYTLSLTIKGDGENELDRKGN